MKKLFCLLMAAAMLLSLCACGGGDSSDATENTVVEETTPEDTAAEEATPEEVVEEGSVTENDNVRVEGIYVDSSYVDQDGAPLKMVYVFATVKAGDTNMSTASTYKDMTIGTNTYSCEFYKNSTLYMPNYYYCRIRSFSCSYY